MTTPTVYLLTGDVGGTNSRLSLYDTKSSCCSDNSVLVRKSYRNAGVFTDDDGHEKDPGVFARKILSPFIKYCLEERTDVKISKDYLILATIASAGVVDNNRVKLTNLGHGLLIDGNAIVLNMTDPYISKVFHCKIINDFVAQGYGCLTLKKDDVTHLYGPSDVTSLPVGPKVCIGAGTGLGECYLTPCSEYGDYTCFPSEGGHVEYAPRNDLEISMFRFLNNKFKTKHRISVERVVSGIGLANVYDFLSMEFPDRIDAKVHQDFLNAGDEQGRIVATNYSPGSLCAEAMDIMMSAYGCEAGSAAIKWIPTGGLFVSGGLTPKNIKHIAGLETEFMKSYLHKGRVSQVLERIPLFAVMSEDLGVRGVHKAAQTEWENFVKKSKEDASRNQKDETSYFKVLQENLILIVTAFIVSFGTGYVISTSSKKR